MPIIARTPRHSDGSPRVASLTDVMDVKVGDWVNLDGKFVEVTSIRYLPPGIVTGRWRAKFSGVYKFGRPTPFHAEGYEGETVEVYA